jgi:predicted RNA-binding Zn-ribbon protein involved in translation (DUF1610 family)
MTNLERLQQDAPEALCPHCGLAANWRLIGKLEDVVEVVCKDCGTFELSRGEFEQAEFDIPPVEERRE